MTAKNRLVEGLYERLEAIESDVKQAKKDAAYTRNFVEAMGAMDGTLAGMAAQLRSLQATVSGKYGAEVKKEQKASEFGLMELGRMPLPEAMKWIEDYQKRNKQPELPPHYGAQGGRERSEEERSSSKDSEEGGSEARGREGDRHPSKPRGQGRR